MSDDVEGERGVWSSVLLVGAVLVIVFTGYVLRANPYEQRARATGESDSAPKPAAEPVLGSVISPVTTPDTAISATPAPPEDPVQASAVVTSAPPPAATEGRPIESPATSDSAAIDPLLSKLANRADRDRARLAKVKERYTAQLVVACRPETVDRLLSAAEGSSKLYVLPARLKDDACFRVCFGTYASQKEAGDASDLPKALRGKDKIGAVEIAKVLL